MPELLLQWLKSLNVEDAESVWIYLADGDDPPIIVREMKLVLEETHLRIKLAAARQ